MSRGDFGVGGGGSEFKLNIGDDFGDGYPTARNTDNEYTRLSNCVSNNIQKLMQKIASLQQMVKEIGTTYDVPGLFEKLQNEQKESNILVKETSAFFKQLNEIQSSLAESRQRKMQQNKLQENFSTALHNLQQVQQKVVEKERESVQRARVRSMEQRDQQHRVTSPLKNSNDNFQFQIQEEADLTIDMIREREDALRQLESDIVDVNEIFKDLAIMVHEQGETVDSIETNVDQTQGNVEQANVEIQKAKSYQAAARKKKCILIIILLLILIILGVIIYFAARP